MNPEKKEEKKRFKITKRQLRKAFNGSISILLCLLITPFLTIALGLVEYARYQEVVSMADEIYELTGISILADYDTYIHDRFGLLATSQENDLDADIEDLLSANKSALGGQAKIENPSVNGITSLADTGVLRQQIVDFSELTVTTSVLAEDFNLEDLLEKLNGLQQFTDITSTVSGLANVTDKLTTALTKFQELETAISSLQGLISSAKTDAETLADQMADLYKKLGENGITLPENATLTEIETAVTSFTDSYLQDFKDLYSTANDLVNSLNSIKTQLTAIKTAAEAVVTAVNEAKAAMDSLGTSNSADTEGEISEEAKSALDEILDEMTSLVDDTISDLKDTTIDSAKQMMDDIIDAAMEETGLAGLTTRYSEIVNGEYFDLPLTDTAKEDIVDLLKVVYTIYKDAENSGSDIYDAIYAYLKKKFVPNLNFSVESLLAKVQGIVDDAEDALLEKAEGSLWTLLSKLVNIVKGMFDLDVFYDGDLNAFVNCATPTTGGYQAFLTAVGNLFQAIEDFGDSIDGWDIFGALDAMGDMLTSIGDMMTAIFDIIGDMLSSLKELGSATIHGDIRTLYEKLLISGYMTHNLPNRTSAGATTYDENGKVVMLNLNGSGLTGFSYDDIARPALYSGQSATLSATGNKTKLQQLSSFINNLQQGHGSDTMFMGAELEYIRAGTNSEIVNQTICFMDLYFLRMLLDLPSIFTSVEVAEVAGAATIAAWVVYILYMVAEPFLDTILLVNGGEVALLKGNCWLTASGISSFLTEFTNVTISNAKLRDQVNSSLKSEMESFSTDYGTSTETSTSTDILPMTYDSYMLLILFIYVDSDMQIERLQDLIKLEASQYYTNNGKSFSIYKTYTSIEVAADLTINTLIDFGALTGGSSIIPETRLKQIVGY